MSAHESQHELRMFAEITRAAAGHAAFFGVPRHALMAKAGLSEGGLQHDSAALSEEALDAIVSLITQHTGFHTLALARLTDTALLGLGLVGTLIANAPSFRESLELATHYAPLLANRNTIVLEVVGDEIVIVLNRVVRSDILHRALTEAALTNLQRLLQRCAGAAARFQRMELDYGAPAHAAAYRDVFGTTPTFGACRTAMVVPRAVADAPNLHHSPSAHLQLSAEADLLRAAKSAEGGVAADVLRVLSASPSSHRMSMEDAAEALGMSTRSLRRKLTHENANFRELGQRALVASSELLLSDPARSVKEVGFSLGFDSARSFSRALHAAFGKSPTALRKGLLASVSERH